MPNDKEHVSNEEQVQQDMVEDTEQSQCESSNIEEAEDANEELDPIALLEKEKEELKNAYMRLSAETDNYRKRIQQEKETFKKIALKGVVENLLPVIDNLERSIEASKNSSNIESLVEGVSMVLTQFEGVLKDAGLETIDLKQGDEFDPQFCEAVMMEEQDDIPYSMTIVDVFEVGRKLGGQVLRTSKVKVAKKKS